MFKCGLRAHFDSAKTWFGFPFARENFNLCKCSQKTTASSQAEVCLMRKENLIWWREQDPCSAVIHQDSTGKARGYLLSLQLQITGIATTDHLLITYRKGVHYIGQKRFIGADL